MSTQQTEALPALIERFRGLPFDHAPDGWPAVRTREITALLDRITELESQLAQRFDAADIATAAQPAAQQVVAYAVLPDERAAFEAWYIAQVRSKTSTTNDWSDDEIRGAWLSRPSEEYRSSFAGQSWEAWQARASHGQAPAGAGMGHTDGGRNMFYEGRFDGESQREQQARLRWANDMRAAFERHTGNGWFDKDWRTETGLWSSAWHACLAAQPTTTAQAADSVPKAQFDDPKVQAVYAILCDEAKPAEGEHWEGFAARRIVDALAADSVLYDPKAVLDVFHSARAGSEKPVGYMRGILAVIAHWESRPEPHRWMVPARADSMQEDAARYRWLRNQPFDEWKRIAWHVSGHSPTIYADRDAAIDAACKQGGAT